MNTSLIHEAKKILADLRKTKLRMDNQLSSLDSYGAWRLKRNSAKKRSTAIMMRSFPAQRKGSIWGMSQMKRS